MLRSAAISRILYALGNRPSGTSLDDQIVLRLQEAQRDLESGKTLPRFLLQEDQTLTLLSGENAVALPEGFIRESDDARIRVTPAGTDTPVFLVRRYYIDATQALLLGEESTQVEESPTPPRVYVIRRSTIDFITEADQDYVLTWDYYRRAAVLASDVENDWLAAPNGAAEWLIGEAGRRIAMDLRNPDAIALFTELRQSGRAACFGEEIAAELASGPLEMGANL